MKKLISIFREILDEAEYIPDPEALKKHGFRLKVNTVQDLKNLLKQWAKNEEVDYKENFVNNLFVDEFKDDPSLYPEYPYPAVAYFDDPQGGDQEYAFIGKDGALYVYTGEESKKIDPHDLFKYSIDDYDGFVKLKK